MRRFEPAKDLFSVLNRVNPITHIIAVKSQKFFYFGRRQSFFRTIIYSQPREHSIYKLLEALQHGTFLAVFPFFLDNIGQILLHK